MERGGPGDPPLGEIARSEDEDTPAGAIERSELRGRSEAGSGRPRASSCPLELVHVWKHYSIGSRADSFRDAIPRFVRGLLRREPDTSAPTGFWALQDVSLRVEKGETFGIIGANGAGKSTILRILSKITKETRGEVKRQGRIAGLIDVGAGFHPDLTGRENIYLNGTIIGLRRREIDALLDSIVAFSGLEPFIDMPVKKYSSGMYIRLGFAIAAHVEPDILLIDEVLAVGDLEFRQKCFQRLLELKQRQTTLILVTHDLDSVTSICDRAMLLDHGQIASEGGPDEVVEFYQRNYRRRAGVQALRTPLGELTFKASAGVQIDVAEAMNAAGEPCSTFETGDSVTLRMEYVADRTIADASVTVILETNSIPRHLASTKRSCVQVTMPPGRGILKLTYPCLDLPAELYSVVVSIFEGESPEPIARFDSPTPLEVTTYRHAHGTVHIDHTWQVG